MKPSSSDVVVMIAGEPWFVLADLCKVLGLTSPAKVLERLDDEVNRIHPIADSMGRTQRATVVSEPGMYEVVIRSDKPEAVAFRRGIRRTGPACLHDRLVSKRAEYMFALYSGSVADPGDRNPYADGSSVVARLWLRGYRRMMRVRIETGPAMQRYRGERD